MLPTLYRTDLPDWVRDNIKTECQYCGSLILDNSDTGVTTARMCANKQCPGHMMHRMSFVGDFFSVKNFGPKTALSYIHAHKCTNHLEILKEWFKDGKPFVTLAEVAVLACIEGYGETQAAKELNPYSSFAAYFADFYRANPLLRANMDYLIECEQYFNIKPALSEKQMFVMATGSFKGYPNRDMFFSEINDAFGKYINVIQTGKRKTGISYLIKEKDAVDHSKSALAAECGIPVVTPAQFLSIMETLCPYFNEEE